MDIKDVIKLAIVAVAYCVMAPALGLILRGRPAWQRPLIFLMCLMIPGGVMGPADWRLTVALVDNGRSPTLGYEFYFTDVIALALLVALALERKHPFRWFPPGLWLYLLYCAACLLSIALAPYRSYVLMAGLKWLKMSLYFVLIYNFVRHEKNLRFLLFCFCVAMFWQLFVVLKLKYLNNIYQVTGTFDHQNSLTMFAGLLGMVFLAVGMGPKQEKSTLFLIGYVACAVIVQSTFSRAGIAVFILGTTGVILFSLIDKITVRRLAVVCSLALIAFFGAAFAVDTLVERFSDEGNRASEETREVLNRAARQMLSDYPLGIGWNNYAMAINPPFRYHEVYDEWVSGRGHTVNEKDLRPVVESHYFLILSETGYQGLATYLLLIFTFLWWGLRCFWHFRYSFVGCVAVGVTMGCTINYLQSFLERVLVQHRNLMLWMILIAVIARIETWRRQAVKQKRTQRRAAAAQQAADPALVAAHRVAQ